MLVEPFNLVIKADTSVISDPPKGSLPMMQRLLFLVELLRNLEHVPPELRIGSIRS